MDKITINQPQDSEWHGLLETDRMNCEAIFQDRHPQIAFDLEACCNLNGKHWNTRGSVSKQNRHKRGKVAILG